MIGHEVFEPNAEPEYGKVTTYHLAKYSVPSIAPLLDNSLDFNSQKWSTSLQPFFSSDVHLFQRTIDRVSVATHNSLFY